MTEQAKNPYQPGAGHSPPYLAGREKERDEFLRLLNQSVILDNVVLTGIRGIGKTALLREFKTSAIEQGWLWVDNDMSESASASEEDLLKRILADLGVKMGGWTVSQKEVLRMGFRTRPETEEIKANYQFLEAVAAGTPGLISDKLKAVLQLAWQIIEEHGDKKGIVFAYDEAQNLSDHRSKNSFPLSMLLDVFSSLQVQQMPFMLVLTGLPPLFAKLVEARTFAERMFRIIQLDNLNRKEARQAILKPLSPDSAMYETFEHLEGPIYFFTQGYPYFVQYWCRELYDYFTSSAGRPQDIVEDIQNKLDADFFDGRWQRLTDRERDLLLIIAHSIPEEREEFTVQQVTNPPLELEIKPFGASQINQMLSNLAQKGIVFKNRHGKYMLAVPLLAGYIRRKTENGRTE